MISCFYWHFIEAPKNIFQAWRNLFYFSLNYFSLKVLFKTLFSPWKKFAYSYGKGFSFGKYFEIFTFNLMSRSIGAIIRLLVIMVGLVYSSFVFLSGLLFLLIWISMPFWLLFIFFYGIKLI